eukprot:CAMPEP_0201491594 /NCGR_PEP_ID=MMETSP0151_2-20130828/30399_1 /ASSEMBLY_ACC=CAM_ASM_000257 /TAXON_ID=200890 /ORGANISM="Paramoeba atlantica, Strain 621/1 / CCAP 1560/9" /LENGTH=243 /DNA_ID=CAMNT_0047878015 /DNA_START=70 /DNA_END=797 /DNA_ORIENTATION=+
MGSMLSRSYGRSMREHYQEKRVQLAVMGSYNFGKEEVLISQQLRHVPRNYKETSQLAQSGRFMGEAEYSSKKMVAQTYTVGGRYSYGSSWNQALEKCDALLFQLDNSDLDVFETLKQKIADPTFQEKPILIICSEGLEFYYEDDPPAVTEENIRKMVGVKEGNQLLKVFIETKELNGDALNTQAFDWLTSTIAATYAEKWAAEEEQEEKKKEEEAKKMKKKLLKKMNHKKRDSPSSPSSPSSP